MVCCMSKNRRSFVPQWNVGCCAKKVWHIGLNHDRTPPSPSQTIVVTEGLQLLLSVTYNTQWVKSTIFSDIHWLICQTSKVKIELRCWYHSEFFFYRVVTQINQSLLKVDINIWHETSDDIFMRIDQKTVINYERNIKSLKNSCLKRVNYWQNSSLFTIWNWKLFPSKSR